MFDQVDLTFGQLIFYGRNKATLTDVEWLPAKVVSDRLDFIGLSGEYYDVMVGDHGFMARREELRTEEEHARMCLTL